MNEIIKTVLDYMEGYIIKDFKQRTPKPNETPEDAEMADFIHEVDFFSIESFKLGFLLGMEIAKK